MTFRNVPKIESVALSVFVPAAGKSPDHHWVSRAMLRTVSGTDPTITVIKKGEGAWGIQKGKRAGWKTVLYGDRAYEFIDKCINLVFPNIKDWPGISGKILAHGM